MEKVCLDSARCRRSQREPRSSASTEPVHILFQELAASPGATPQPRISVWNEYTLEIRNASQRLWLQEATPVKRSATSKGHPESWNRHRTQQNTGAVAGFPPSFVLIVLLVAAISRRPGARKRGSPGHGRGNRCARTPAADVHVLTVGHRALRVPRLSGGVVDRP